VVLALHSPLVFAGAQRIILPHYDAQAGELLNDPRVSCARWPMNSFAAEFARSVSPTDQCRELDLFAHEMSRVPRSATPGDTSSRLHGNWLRNNE